MNDCDCIFHLLFVMDGCVMCLCLFTRKRLRHRLLETNPDPCYCCLVSFMFEILLVTYYLVSVYFQLPFAVYYYLISFMSYLPD